MINKIIVVISSDYAKWIENLYLYNNSQKAKTNINYPNYSSFYKNKDKQLKFEVLLNRVATIIIINKFCKIRVCNYV